MRLHHWLADFAQDVRLVVRQIRRAPGISALVVTTLAVGIGANITLFGAIRELLLQQPEDVRDPEAVVRLLAVSRLTRAGGTAIGAANYPLLLDLQRAGTAFESVAGFTSRQVSIGTGRDAYDTQAAIVSANFFTVLGAKPLLGRTFSAADGYPSGETLGGTPLVVLGYGLWQRRYGADSRVLGTVLRVGATMYRIVGVMPAGFKTVEAEAPELWLPITVAAAEPDMSIDLTDRSRYALALFGRVRSGISHTIAEQQAAAVWAREEHEVGNSRDGSVHIVAASLIRARGPDAPREVRVTLWLAGVAVLVLFITCANVANLLLGRALSRRHEIAVRLALGAGRGRLARQMLAEGVVLATIGAAAALSLAALGGPMLSRLLLGGSSDRFFDPALFGFAAAIALGTGIVVSLAPAFQNTHCGYIDDLRSATSSGSRRAARFRMALVTVQSALCMVMLVVALLFALSLRRVEGLDLGLDVGHTIRALVDLDNLLVSNDVIEGIYGEMLQQVRALPGVNGAALAGSDPYLGGRAVGAHTIEHDADYFWPRGVAQIPIEAAVGDGFFGAVGATSLRGRDFDRNDTQSGPPVAIINAPLARILYPGEDVLGRCVVLPTRARQNGGGCVTIVGLLNGVWYASIVNREKPMVYIPLAQQAAYAGYLRPQGIFVHVRGDPGHEVEEIRRTLQGVRNDLPAVRVTVLGDVVDAEMRPWRLGTVMFGLFGIIAFVVAVIGLYSVVAFAAAEQSFEIAIRLALGARPRDILATVARRGLTAITAGLAIGAIGALALRRWLGPLLFRTASDDPRVIVGVAVTLLFVGFLAVLVPTLRAIRLDSAIILRSS